MCCRACQPSQGLVWDEAGFAWGGGPPGMFPAWSAAASCDEELCAASLPSLFLHPLHFFFIWEYYPELGPSLEVMERFLTKKPGLVWAEHSPGCSEPWWPSKEATPTSLSRGKPRSAPTPVSSDPCLEGAGPGSACVESCRA